jgi:hypothetical protein
VRSMPSIFVVPVIKMLWLVGMTAFVVYILVYADRGAEAERGCMALGYTSAYVPVYVV